MSRVDMPQEPQGEPRPSYSDLEEAFGSFFRHVGTLRSVIAGAFAFGCALWLVVALVEGDLQTLRRNPGFVSVPLLVVLAAALYLVERRAGGKDEASPRDVTVEQTPSSGDPGSLVTWRGVLFLLMGVVVLGLEWSADHGLHASRGAWGLHGGFSRIDVLLLVVGWVFGLQGLRTLLGGTGAMAGEGMRKVALIGLVLGLANAYWLGAYRGLSVGLLLEWAPLFVIVGLVVALLRWTASSRPPES